jgi:hypothetical protein
MNEKQVLNEAKLIQTEATKKVKEKLFGKDIKTVDEMVSEQQLRIEKQIRNINPENE